MFNHSENNFILNQVKYQSGQRVPQSISTGILKITDSGPSDRELERSTAFAIKILASSGHNIPLHDFVQENVTDVGRVLMKWIKSGIVLMIFTVGGTELSGGNIATDTLLSIVAPDRRLTGIEYTLYHCSLKHSPMSVLSRFVAGVRDNVLLITLPRNFNVMQECIEAVLPILKHGVFQILQLDNTLPQPDPKFYKPCVNSIAQREPLPLHIPSRQKCLPIRDKRRSSNNILPVQEALNRIYEAADLLINNLSTNIEAVYYTECLGRVLASDLKARQSVPPYDVSLVDGYALQFDDHWTNLNVINTADTDSTVELGSGSCVHIRKGECVPLGADCVIPTQNVVLMSRKEIKSDRNDMIIVEEEDYIQIIKPAFKIGQFIHPKGFDLQSDTVFKRGLRIGPSELSLLCSAGLLAPWESYDLSELGTFENGDVSELEGSVVNLLRAGGHIPCIAQFRIAIMSVGSELFDAVLDSKKARIRDSNRPLLISLLNKYGYKNITDLGIIPYEYQSLESAFNKAISICDIIINIGVVHNNSGPDLITELLNDKFNATMHFSEVLMKPGKSTKFLTIPNMKQQKSVLVYCLPRNPINIFIITHLFILPLLRKLDYFPKSEWSLPCVDVRLCHPVKLDERPACRCGELVWRQMSDKSTHPSNTNSLTLSCPTFAPSTSVSIPCAKCHQFSDDDPRFDNSSRSIASSSMKVNLLLMLPPVMGKLTKLPVNSVVKSLICGDLY